MIYNLDEAAKQRMSKAASRLIDVIVKETLNPFEALAVLKLATESLKQACGVEDTIPLGNITEKLQ